jgi:hypothetical protein
MLYGFNNVLNLELEMVFDTHQLALQADVFARQVLSHATVLQLRHILGREQRDWLRLLHEVYIFDRLKCVFYGVSAYNLMNFPSETYSFPGNILLMNLLAKKRFEYQTNDAQPFTLQVSIDHLRDLQVLFKPLFDIYPDMEEGISYDPAFPVYVNTNYERILKGLRDSVNRAANNFNRGNGRNGGNNNNNNRRPIFELIEMNDSRIETFTLVNSNPGWNSFLSKDGTKFSFILPEKDSVPEALRFNESLHFGRAVGFVSNGLSYSGNNFYTVANRNPVTDFMTREEVYAITGLRSEIIPYTIEQITKYMGVNSYVPDWKVSFERGGMSDDSDATP